MILESIVTTVSEDGITNVAPMGPLVTDVDAMLSNQKTDPRFILRPFEGSTTFANLRQTRRATIHVTDDARLMARAAIGDLTDSADLVRPVNGGRHAVLIDCHRWFAVEIERVIETPPRFDMHCRVVESAIVRPFFGFNRAKHAVVEAAILATRTHLLPNDQIRQQLQQLSQLIEKTAGPREADAFALLTTEIEHRLSHNTFGSRSSAP